MDKIEKILSTYSNTELAFLYKYRLPLLLSPSKEKIKKYIFEIRGLNESEIEEFVNIKNSKSDPDNLHCPRCLSEKFTVVESDEFEDKINFNCNVCGLTFQDSAKKKQKMIKEVVDFLSDLFEDFN